MKCLLQPVRTARWACLACAGLAMGLGGCSGSPFVGDAPVRSPYERYELLRGTTRPATTVDSFGRERPALRARLAPLDPQ